MVSDLGHSVNESVVVRLKWGQTEYKGRLVSIDSYMNIQLSDAEEYLDQKLSSVLGSVLIRYAFLNSLIKLPGWISIWGAPFANYV